MNERSPHLKSDTPNISEAWIWPDVPTKRAAREEGFTLLEAVIALLLMTIIALGSASLFSYSIYNNSGASNRATSIAIAQEALELLRSAQYNATTTDATLVGGITTQTGIVRGGRSFNLTKTIDDDPSTSGNQVN